jgi:hypothetical protein
MKEELKLLIRFLKQNNAYSNYRHNVRRDTFFHINTPINPYNIIVISFDWFSTREHFCYWEILDDKWRKYYDIHKREPYKYESSTEYKTC